MTKDKMVRPGDHSSGTENADGHKVPAHQRNDSNGSTRSMIKDDVPAASFSQSPVGRPVSKRRKSVATSKTKSRPSYSRKYSTPPSRPLSPAGFPKHLELDMAIPELNLSEAHFRPIVQQTRSAPVVNYSVCADTAPQNPDIWSDPETDYFSTIEGSNPKHYRGKSRRLASQNNLGSLNAFMNPNAGNTGLQQVREANENDFSLPPTPGGFSG